MYLPRSQETIDVSKKLIDDIIIMMTIIIRIIIIIGLRNLVDYFEEREARSLGRSAGSCYSNESSLLNT